MTIVLMFPIGGRCTSAEIRYYMTVVLILPIGGRCTSAEIRYYMTVVLMLPIGGRYTSPTIDMKTPFKLLKRGEFLISSRYASR